MAWSCKGELEAQHKSILTNYWVTSYWTLGGPKVFKTGESHLSCKVWWKLVRFEANVVKMSVNIILSGEKETHNWIYYVLAKQPNFKSTVLPIIKLYYKALQCNSSAIEVSYSQLLPPHIGFPGLRFQDKHASRTEMSVDPLEETL